MALLTLPLSHVLYRSLPTPVPVDLVERIRRRVAADSGSHLISVDKDIRAPVTGDPEPGKSAAAELTVAIRSTGAPTPRLADDLARLAQAYYEERVRLRVTTQLVLEATVEHR